MGRRPPLPRTRRPRQVTSRQHNRGGDHRAEHHRGHHGLNYNDEGSPVVHHVTGLDPRRPASRSSRARPVATVGDAPSDARGPGSLVGTRVRGAAAVGSDARPCGPTPCPSTTAAGQPSADHAEPDTRAGHPRSRDPAPSRPGERQRRRHLHAGDDPHVGWLVMLPPVAERQPSDRDPPSRSRETDPAAVPPDQQHQQHTWGRIHRGLRVPRPSLQ